MKNGRIAAVVVAAVVGMASAAELEAQRGRNGPPQVRGERVGPVQGERGRAASVEQALRQWERLDLTEEQIAQLEALEAEQIAEARVRQDEMRALQSRVRSGEITINEVREQLESRSDGAESAREARADRLSGILNEEQMQSLRRRSGPGVGAQRLRQGGQNFRGGSGRSSFGRGGGVTGRVRGGVGSFRGGFDRRSGGAIGRSFGPSQRFGIGQRRARIRR